MPLIHGLIVTLARSPRAAATSGGGYGAAAFPAGGHAMPPRALAGFTFALQRGHLTSRVRWCSTTSFPVSYQARSTRARTCGAVVIKARGVVVRFGLVVVLPPSLARLPQGFRRHLVLLRLIPSETLCIPARPPAAPSTLQVGPLFVCDVGARLGGVPMPAVVSRGRHQAGAVRCERLIDC
ncbi:hypothetical protein VFPBJ_04780 [Purpureocillium lilacinum]|uniref:Uncharacterized protein n=1 Tax=Purpureocillium lilacinum TaxID=33203 RepID=A0A179GW51_PURLI|nr:hypothetical protein VFPBJ_04780 [Purpureocillium lilacinum]